jgi:hypothetical protein
MLEFKMNMTLHWILNITSVAGAILGSALLALNIGLAVPGYICFLLSSLASVWLLLKAKGSPKALVVQNVYFIGVNVFGLIRWS